jgi:acetyl esterase/lipase
MPIIDRVDPEIAAVMRTLPYTADLDDLEAARQQYTSRFEAMGVAPPDPAVDRADHTAPGADGHPDVLVRVFRPAGAAGPLPALLWIQGGGYVLTNPTLDDPWCEQIAVRHGCVVASVAWRRAPEHPFPAAAEDCYAGLNYVVGNAERLGVDAGRVAIGGASSGGGSAAGLGLLVRDRGELSLVHQMLIYPMLDDTNTSPASHAVTDPQVWNRAKNLVAWRHYLGDAHGTGDVSPYAAPTRMEHLAGLPPTSILTGELDLFVDENLDYAQRLIQQGVATELHVYPGATHAFDRVAPDSRVARRFFHDRDAILERVFAPAA